MMRINNKIFLLFTFLYCLEDLLVQASKNVTTYTTKQVEVLQCNFKSDSVTVQWTELPGDGKAYIVIFSYDVRNGAVRKVASDIKYNNFNHSVNGSSEFNLLITDVDKDDGGVYQCILFAADPLIFSVSVEVLPASISIDCTNSNACPSSAETISSAAPYIVCNCTATGVTAKRLEIEWTGASIYTTSNTTRDMDPTTGTVTISSEITLAPANGTSSVSCVVTGYTSQIPEMLRSFTYTFSPPVCNLSQDCSSDGTSASLICSCDGGTLQVNTYTFYDSKKSAIGTQDSNFKSVQVEPNRTETFYCSGCNGVMMSNQMVESKFSCQHGVTKWGFAIVICILFFVFIVAALIVVGLIVCKYKRCCKGTQEYDISQLPVKEEEIGLNSQQPGKSGTGGKVKEDESVVVINLKKDGTPEVQEIAMKIGQENTSTETRTSGDGGETKLEVAEPNDGSSGDCFYLASDKFITEGSSVDPFNTQGSSVDPFNTQGSSVDPKVEDSQKKSENSSVLPGQLFSGTEDTWHDASNMLA